MFGFFKKKTNSPNSKVLNSDKEHNYSSHSNDEHPFEVLHNLAEENHDVFGIFLFLAKLDNRFMAREKEAVVEFAIRKSGCLHICSDDVDNLYATWPKPSINEFRTMLSNIPASEHAQDFVTTCAAILGRQSYSNPMAKIVMDEIRASIGGGHHGI